MKTRLARTTPLCGVIITGLFFAGGCASHRIVVTSDVGGPEVRLMADMPGEFRVCVLPPRVTSNLSNADEAYWGKTLQTQIEGALQETARQRGFRVVLVSPPEDQAELLNQQDLRSAGLAKAAPANETPQWTDRDVFISGELRVTVSNQNVGKDRWQTPVNGAPLRVVESVPRRTTTVHANFRMVNNSGERLAPIAVHTQPVVSDGDTLGPYDQDLQDALSQVAPAFAAEFFPEIKTIGVKLESCGEPECKAALRAVACAADDTGDVAGAVQAAQTAVDVHPECHKAQFLLAVALKLDGQLEQAMRHLERAITLSGCDKKLNNPRPSKREKARNHPYMAFRELLNEEIRFRQTQAGVDDEVERRRLANLAAPIDANETRSRLER